jgi:hypothetical protein
VYQILWAYSMAEGAFFSKQAWKGGEQHAVLNGKAAFDLFGSIRAAGSRQPAESPLEDRGRNLDSNRSDKRRG